MLVAQVLRQIRVLVKAVERAGQVREAVPQALELAIRLQAETRLGQSVQAEHSVSASVCGWPP